MRTHVTRGGSVAGAWRVGAVAAVVLAAAALVTVGPVSFPTGVDATTLASLLGLAFLALACRGIALRGALGVLGTRIGRGRAVGLFLATTFVGCLAPFGRAAGTPVNGLLVSTATDADYEQSLAAVVAVDVVVSVVGLSMGIVGLGRSARPDPAALLVLPLVAVVVAVCWRFRGRLVGALGRLLTVPARLLGRAVPSKSPPSRAAVTERVETVLASVEQVARSPRRLAGIVAFVALGQVVAAAGLWLALDAVGSAVPFALVIGLLPLAGLGTLVPSPGGAAGVEAALVGLLVSVAGVAVPPASAAVLLYRTATFWAPLPVGGLFALALGGREVLAAAPGPVVERAG